MTGKTFYATSILQFMRLVPDVSALAVDILRAHGGVRIVVEPADPAKVTSIKPPKTTLPARGMPIAARSAR